ncbi:MAG: hypothetical protein IPI77_17215 [Saprospiraceae bacterium]|nr:hypothetical protein [Saprospiraceae bacterium]
MQVWTFNLSDKTTGSGQQGEDTIPPFKPDIKDQKSLSRPEADILEESLTVWWITISSIKKLLCGYGFVNDRNFRQQVK